MDKKKKNISKQRAECKMCARMKLDYFFFIRIINNYRILTEYVFVYISGSFKAAILYAYYNKALTRNYLFQNTIFMYNIRNL